MNEAIVAGVAEAEVVNQQVDEVGPRKGVGASAVFSRSAALVAVICAVPYLMGVMPTYSQVMNIWPVTGAEWLATMLPIMAYVVPLSIVALFGYDLATCVSAFLERAGKIPRSRIHEGIAFKVLFVVALEALIATLAFVAFAWLLAQAPFKALAFDASTTALCDQSARFGLLAMLIIGAFIPIKLLPKMGTFTLYGFVVTVIVVATMEAICPLAVVFLGSFLMIALTTLVNGIIALLMVLGQALLYLIVGILVLPLLPFIIRNVF